MKTVLKTSALALSFGATIIIAPAALAADAGGTSAATATAGAVGNSAAVQATKGEAKKYCLKVEASTGTRLGKKSCKTKQEWADEGVEIGTPK